MVTTRTRLHLQAAMYAHALRPGVYGEGFARVQRGGGVCITSQQTAAGSPWRAQKRFMNGMDSQPHSAVVAHVWAVHLGVFGAVPIVSGLQHVSRISASSVLAFPLLTFRPTRSRKYWFTERPAVLTTWTNM